MSTRPPGTPVRVRLVDEPLIVARGLAELLHDNPEIHLVPESTPARVVDLTLFDCFRPGRSLSEGTERLVSLAEEGRVALFTWHPSDALGSWATSHGAVGCLAKDTPEDQLAEALVALASGDAVVEDRAPGRRDLLAPREQQVLWLIASGLSNHQVACELGLSINSVKSYVRTVYRKIDVTTRTQAVLWALENGIGQLLAPGPNGSAAPPPHPTGMPAAAPRLVRSRPLQSA